MSISVGPLTVSWGANPSNNKTNVSYTSVTGLVATGVILGVAGTYAAPKVIPPVTSALNAGTIKTVAFVKGLFGNKSEEVIVNIVDNKESQHQQQPENTRGIFGWFSRS